jgi:type II secretory ATPase GspE/PulE/Tfp pilus assembly ATPase PilB-like protein
MRLLRRRQEGGYLGRLPVAEMAVLDDGLRQAILARGDIGRLNEAIQRQSHHQPLHAAAGAMVQSGRTDEAEVRRVLGAPVDEGCQS